MQISPEANRSPFLLYELDGSNLGAGSACGFPRLCLSPSLAEEETLLCLGAGGEDRGHRKGSAERREQEMEAGEWGTSNNDNGLGFHLCSCSLCQPRHGNSWLFSKPKCRPEDTWVG